MPSGIGRNAYIGLAKESSFGSSTAPTTFIEFTTESIKKDLESLKSAANIGSRFAKDIYQGAINISGDFSYEVNPVNSGLILGALFGQDDTDLYGGASNTYEHVFKPVGSSQDLPSLSIEVGRDIKQMRYVGCKIGSFSISAALHSIITSTVSIVGRNEDDSVSAATPSFSNLRAFIFTDAGLTIDSAPVAYVKTFSVTFNNNLNEDGYVLDGNNYRAHIFQQSAEVTGTMDLEFTTDSYAERTKFLNGSDAKLELTFTHPDNVDSSDGVPYKMIISLPVVKYTSAEANVGGPDAIGFTINFESVVRSSSDLPSVTLINGESSSYV